MPILMCSKGHLFNAELYDSCNICAKDEDGSLLDQEEPGVTMPLGLGNGYGSTIPLVEGTKYDATIPLGDGMNYESTIPVKDEGKVKPGTGPLSAVTLFELPNARTELRDNRDGALPTVGWVVIVGGPGIGHDFSLVPGQNFIGRDEDMEISLNFGDSLVSRREHALIIFDMDANECFVSNNTTAGTCPN